MIARVVISSPAQLATGDLSRIRGFDEIAVVINAGPPVVEDGGAPGYRLNFMVAGESCRDGPVAPDQRREEVIASRAIHVDRLSVIGLRSVELGKEQRTFAGVIEHRSGEQN